MRHRQRGVDTTLATIITQRLDPENRTYQATLLDRDGRTRDVHVEKVKKEGYHWKIYDGEVEIAHNFYSLRSLKMAKNLALSVAAASMANIPHNISTEHYITGEYDKKTGYQATVLGRDGRNRDVYVEKKRAAGFDWRVIARGHGIARNKYSPRSLNEAREIALSVATCVTSKNRLLRDLVGRR